MSLCRGRRVAPVFIASCFAAACASDPRPTPAAGPLEVSAASAPFVERLVADAGVVRSVDEMSDRTVAEAATAVLVAERDEVRDFAERLVSEYGALRDRQRAIGLGLGFTPLKGERAERFERDVEADMLSLIQARGPGFDRAFLERIVEGHEAALGSIEGDLLVQATHPEVRESVRKDFRPLVRKHLDEARRLLAALGPS